jgi:phosphomethylpyrimidine synthase
MGGADGMKPGAAKKSAALTEEQQEILSKRGVLSPEEIHRLASKTKTGMKKASGQPGTEASSESKLSCHSDYVDPETAKKVQREVLVQVDVRPALGIGKEDRVV